MADNSAEIAKLEAILNLGATEVVADGRRVKYDLEEVRRRLRALRASDDSTRGKRPRAASVDLSGF